MIKKDIKAFSTVLSGATIAQIAAFCFAPIVSRLYSTDDFGIAALFFAIAQILVPASSLRYNHAIFLPKDDAEATEMIVLCTIVNAIASFFILLVIIFLKSLFTINMVDQLGSWIYLLPVAFFIYGETEITKCACTRWKKHKTLASSDIIRSTTAPLLRIASGFAVGSTIAGLIFSMLIAELSGNGTLWFSIKNIISKNRTKMNQKRAFSLLRQYREFPQYTLPTAMLLSLSDNIIVMFFGQFFAASLLGILGMTRRLVRIPLNTINNSLRTILIPKIVEKTNHNLPLLRLYSKTVFALFLAGLIPFLLLIKYGDLVFGIYLGEQWRDVGRYAAYLAPIMFTQFLNTPSAVLLLALRRQNIRLFLQIFYFVTSLLALILGFAITQKPEPTIIYYSLAGSVVNLLGLVIGFRAALAWDRALKA